MRDNIRAFVSAAAETFPCRGPIYEFGSYIVLGQEKIGDLRPLFPGRKYVGCDMRKGPGVDRIEDLSELNLPDESVETIICVETLEHCFHVERAVDEMLRVLKPGGLLLISTPFQFHLHDYPDDYWRLTPACLARLLSPLPAAMIGWQGVDSFPHTVFALGCKGPTSIDFEWQAGNFRRAFKSRLKALHEAEPWRTKFKRKLVGPFRSKGERKNAEMYYKANFASWFTVKQAQPKPQPRPQPPTQELRNVPSRSISTSATSPGFI